MFCFKVWVVGHGFMFVQDDPDTFRTEGMFSQVFLTVLNTFQKEQNPSEKQYQKTLPSLIGEK